MVGSKVPFTSSRTEEDKSKDVVGDKAYQDTHGESKHTDDKRDGPRCAVHLGHLESSTTKVHNDAL